MVRLPILAAAAALSVMSACTSVDDLDMQNAYYVTVPADHDLSQVWDVTHRTVADHLDILSVDPAKGLITAESGWYWGGIGEWVGVEVYPAATDGRFTVVKVETLDKYRYQMTGPDWGKELTERIRGQLADRDIQATVEVGPTPGAAKSEPSYDRPASSGEPMAVPE